MIIYSYIFVQVHEDCTNYINLKLKNHACTELPKQPQHGKNSLSKGADDLISSKCRLEMHSDTSTFESLSKWAKLCLSAH